MRSQVSAGTSYRPEIDGLRAVAVISVILYHLKLEIGGALVLPGGFQAWTSFFVLSGYLITRLIMVEIDTTGRLNLSASYGRRVRRILPAFLLVVLASLPAAWLILLPSELEHFAQSIVAALLFVANIFCFLNKVTTGQNRLFFSRSCTCGAWRSRSNSTSSSRSRSS